MSILAPQVNCKEVLATGWGEHRDLKQAGKYEKIEHCKPMVRTLAPNNIDIEKSEVARYLGYGKDGNPSAQISSLIDSQISEASRLIEPSYFCVMKEVENVEASRISLRGNNLVFSSNIVARRIFSKCSKAAIFLTTIGPRLEERVSQLMDGGEILKGAILDAVGSEAVEKVASWVEASIKETAAASGAEVSLRYSPGYCDWDIKEQKVLFSALDGDLHGVELTEDCLMMPKKSISGIIGIGFDSSITLSPCLFCNKTDCPSRRL